MSRVTLFPLVSALPLTDSMTALKRCSRSVGGTDRSSRSIRALLFSGDNIPLDDRICGGFRVSASSITSETLGKVAHPPPRISRETGRKNMKKGLRAFIVYSIGVGRTISNHYGSGFAFG